MFVDIAKIFIKAGKGGDGIVSFRTEKYVAAGGPNGGDGGKGGDVIIQVDKDLSTLMDFKYKKHYHAENGKNGGANNCTGKSGQDLIIKVPPGTIVKNSEDKILGDIVHDQDIMIISKGGRGGRGNARFASSTRQVPRFSELGEDGEQLEITLELKLIADVGLVGFPNVGKSTILSVMTPAKPKIANYHFTTLQPNLGVVKLDNGESFVLADIPGIIEGAHQGVGLGHDFLRHIERTRIIVHVIDISGIEERDPLEDFNTINNELGQYNLKLSNRTQVVACNKTDLPASDKYIEDFKLAMQEKNIEMFPISAVTGKGLKELFYRVSQLLKEVKEAEIQDESCLDTFLYTADSKGWNIVKENDIYVIDGDAIKRIMRKINFDDSESLQYFQRTIKKMGISEELEKMGISDGDTVKIFDIEFEYMK